MICKGLFKIIDKVLSSEWKIENFTTHELDFPLPELHQRPFWVTLTVGPYVRNLINLFCNLTYFENFKFLSAQDTINTTRLCVRIDCERAKQWLFFSFIRFCKKKNWVLRSNSRPAPIHSTLTSFAFPKINLYERTQETAGEKMCNFHVRERFFISRERRKKYERGYCASLVKFPACYCL